MRRGKLLLMVTTALAGTFASVAVSIDVNALLRLKTHRAYISNSAPLGVSVSVDTDDIFAAGLVFAIAIALTPAQGILNSLLFTCLPLRYQSRIHRLFFLSPKNLWGQGIFFALVTLIGIGPLIALDFLVFHGLRGAIIKVDGVQMSPHELESMGIPSLPYRSQRYIRVMAIVPWLAILFNIIALPFVLYAGSHWQEDLGPPAPSTPSAGFIEMGLHRGPKLSTSQEHLRQYDEVS
ncbi:uncharacterized protein STEHIDRAFT_142524 [Stereum hirsutum FP-91666 SS1]|uniref:uncharacterized protein n=1 Tax=Stereum hirsutum (strain FP-91666) TaxID=721885 RepID=UPI0004449D2D|nr:uncharacterized protein STEHIDRAFT_142524 [Stereum hirsutum FP-91666 SS1]EIM80547.1 hypothetical protein STEHIDRAFT_142524 [Stereum hirsutum FP-91666 SS1]